VCFATVNNVMEAYDSEEFRRVMNEADLVAPDGIPVVWALRLKGFKAATRVYGPDVTLQVLEAAAREGIPVGFYGGSEGTLGRLVEAVRARFPALRVAYSWSPPFRPLTAEEDDRVVRGMNGSGARIVFVGTGRRSRSTGWRRTGARCGRCWGGGGVRFPGGDKRQAPRWMIGRGWNGRSGWRRSRGDVVRYLKHPRFGLWLEVARSRWGGNHGGRGGIAQTAKTILPMAALERLLSWRSELLTGRGLSKLCAIRLLPGDWYRQHPPESGPRIAM
jgi:N-acetylglucosaminyldiphosphoundecaprenol N-acetyl-beta-D-mannosaminyltransferase